MLLSAELVFRAWNDLELFQRLDYKTLQLVQTQQSFDGNPLYAVLHEPIYCQGYVNFVRPCSIAAQSITVVTLGTHLNGLHLVLLGSNPNSLGHMSRRYQIQNHYISLAKWCVYDQNPANPSKL